MTHVAPSRTSSSKVDDIFPGKHVEDEPATKALSMATKITFAVHEFKHFSRLDSLRLRPSETKQDRQIGTSMRGMSLVMRGLLHGMHGQEDEAQESLLYLAVTSADNLGLGSWGIQDVRLTIMAATKPYMRHNTFHVGVTAEGSAFLLHAGQMYVRDSIKNSTFI